MKTVELYGLPASGKSYQANALSIEGVSTRPRFGSRVHMLRYAVIFWLRHPLFTISLFLVILRYSSGLKEMAIKCLNGLGYRLAYYYCPVNDEVKVIHEGMLHNIYGLANQELTEPEIKKLLRRMPQLSDTLLCLEVSQQLRMERARSRGRLVSRTKDAAEGAELDKVISSNFALTNTLIDQIESLQSRRVLLKENDTYDISSLVR